MRWNGMSWNGMSWNGMSWNGISALVAVVALAAAAPWTSAEVIDGLPGGSAAPDLEIVDDVVFKLDGEELERADIYYSPYEVFHLVMAPELDAPLMISPRGRSVQRVDVEKLRKLGRIAAELEAGAAIAEVGRYSEQRGVITFELDGREASLEPRPPMLGRQSAESMGERHRRFAHEAKNHRPKRAGLKSLPVRGGEVLVRVFFRSDSKICERIVPRIMAFEEELRGARKSLRFEYYGLPRRIPDDELAAAEGINGVPSAIVYVDGEEVGRLRALQLDRPEEQLLRLLSP